MKKFAAILIVAVLIFGWVFSIVGFGDGGNLADRMSLGLDMIGGVSVVLEAETDATGAELKSIMEQVQAIMERRVNEMGLSEPTIAIENENRIRIELPGAQNAQEAIETIGKTAKLRFMTADGNFFLDGEHVNSASASQYQGYETSLMGYYCVNLDFDSEAQSAFEKATRSIVNGEIKSNYNWLNDNCIAIFLDEECISYPGVTQVISSSQCQITGTFTQSEASNLAALIRGGSLPVSLKEIQTEIVGPTLGLNAAQKSVVAGVIGIALVFAIMFVMYRILGLVADIALGLYVLIVLWILVAFNAVLTLPGIAGIILSVGMAVDSNVIIFTRIKEEIALGKSVRVSLQSGYKRALGTIVDSQVTTIIAAIILYEFGSGSVRGFAMTLLIGIVVSLFTAVVVSNLLTSLLADIKSFNDPSKFGVTVVGEKETEVKYNFIAKRKLSYIASASILLIGLVTGLIRGFNMGIDFTGGTMLQLNMGKEVIIDEVQNAINEYDLNASVLYAGSENEKIIIKTVKVLDNETRQQVANDVREYFGLETAENEFIEQAGLIGPSVGEQLKSNAFKSLGLACIAMLIYIAIRFEWRFGIASILALCHDSLLLLAFYGLLHIQINSPFIAAILTVIGYSINDTIVIFDRIRENMSYAKKQKIEKLIEISVTQSISRSIMTSVTTMLAIIPLIIMCGSSIRSFSIPIMIGVVGGTFSSIFIAPALYYDIQRLTRKNKYRGAK